MHGTSLLGRAVEAFAATGSPEREQRYTRRACAELLLERGALLDEASWKNVLLMGSRGLLALLWERGRLPAELRVLAARGDLDAVRSALTLSPASTLHAACIDACVFGHDAVAELIFTQCCARDAELERRVEQGPGRGAFLAALADVERDEAAADSCDLWRSYVVSQVRQVIDRDVLDEFQAWLTREPWLLSAPASGHQVALLEHAIYTGREPFIRALLAAEPAILTFEIPPPSAAIEYTFEYGHADYLPLMAQIWAVPDDLPHAAGVGDLTRVERWFDDQGRAALGDPMRHFPMTAQRKLAHLGWGSDPVQHVLDAAFAWACLNQHFAVADFLLAHGADINTVFSTHEPASLLHECAIQGQHETARYLITRGIDLTLRDQRWNSTAEGWAREAAGDEVLATLLAEAQKNRAGD
ncbi:MAG: ankyrin repeat domain-containing protein [Polyangiales bacterium]